MPLSNQTKVLLIGKFNPNQNIYTYPSSFITAFKKVGAKLRTLNLFEYEAFAQKGFLFKKISSFFLNMHFIRAAFSFKPSIIFIIKGSLITEKTLKIIKLKTPNTIIIHFYPDNPFCFWNNNSNVNVLQTLRLIDVFLIWSKQLIPILKSAGCKQVQYFPFGVDEEIYKKTNFSREELIPFQSDATFIGTWDKEREDFLTHIIKNMPHLNLAIWGNKWAEELPTNSILKEKIKGTAIYKNELLKAFAGTKIVLNFIRPQNLEAHNMRTFEVLASGNFLLTQKTIEQSQYPFIEGHNIACFSDPEDLIKKIAFYVNQDTLRREVAERGHLLISHGFSIQAQIRSLWNTLEIKGAEHD